MRPNNHRTSSSEAQNKAFGSTRTVYQQKFRDTREGLLDELDKAMEVFIKTGDSQELCCVLEKVRFSKFSLPEFVRQTVPCWFESKFNTGFGSTTQGQVSLHFKGRKSLSVFVTVHYSKYSPYRHYFHSGCQNHRLSNRTNRFFNEIEEEIVSQIVGIEDFYSELAL